MIRQEHKYLVTFGPPSAHGNPSRAEVVTLESEDATEKAANWIVHNRMSGEDFEYYLNVYPLSNPAKYAPVRTVKAYPVA